MHNLGSVHSPCHTPCDAFVTAWYTHCFSLPFSSLSFLFTCWSTMLHPAARPPYIPFAVRMLTNLCPLGLTLCWSTALQHDHICDGPSPDRVTPYLSILCTACVIQVLRPPKMIQIKCKTERWPSRPWGVFMLRNVHWKGSVAANALTLTHLQSGRRRCVTSMCTPQPLGLSITWHSVGTHTHSQIMPYVHNRENNGVLCYSNLCIM